MARIRMIKPEFWDDEKLSSISRDARLTFIGMWNNADDYAVVKGHHSWLKNNIFPYDDIKISEFQKWLLELEGIGVISPFESNGEKYYYIKNFLKHQTINRPSQVKNPTPPDNINEYSVNTQGVLTSQIKLKEIKLKEKEINTSPEKSGSSYSKDFLLFWENYPKKSGSKKAAFDNWKKLNGVKPAIETILEAIRKQIEWRKNAGDEFRPEWKDPERWIKNHMWEAELNEKHEISLRDWALKEMENDNANH